MDGHEWADVVEYQNQTFLPKITNYKAWVATYELKSENDPELIKIMPKLKQGERGLSPSTTMNVVFTIMMRCEISGEFIPNN